MRWNQNGFRTKIVFCDTLCDGIICIHDACNGGDTMIINGHFRFSGADDDYEYEYNTDDNTESEEE